MCSYVVECPTGGMTTQRRAVSVKLFRKERANMAKPMGPHCMQRCTRTASLPVASSLMTLVAARKRARPKANQMEERAARRRAQAKESPASMAAHTLAQAKERPTRAARANTMRTTACADDHCLEISAKQSVHTTLSTICFAPMRAGRRIILVVHSCGIDSVCLATACSYASAAETDLILTLDLAYVIE